MIGISLAATCLGLFVSAQLVIAGLVGLVMLNNQENVRAGLA